MNFKTQIEDLRRDFTRTENQLEKRRKAIKEKHGAERLKLDREIAVLRGMASEISVRLFELVKRQEFYEKRGANGR